MSRVLVSGSAGSANPLTFEVLMLLAESVII